MKKLLMTMLMMTNVYASMNSEAISAYEEKCGVEAISVVESTEVDSDYDYADYSLIMSDGGEVNISVMKGPGSDVNWPYETSVYLINEVFCN